MASVDKKITPVFPAWTPAILINHYQTIYDSPNAGLYHKKIRKCLIAITTHPKMEKVWKMLYKKWTRYGCPEHKTAKFENGAMALSLFSAIQGAINEVERKKTTRHEDAQKYLDIAKDAIALAVKIKQSQLNKSPLHWFPDSAINTMLARDIKTEKSSGYFCLAYDESDFHKKGGIYTRNVIKDLNGNDIWQYQQIAKNTREFFKNQCITPNYPILAEILKSVADEAEEMAKHEATRQRIVNKTSISEKTIFIRALYPFWIKYFGSPLYRTFATLCRVVLDDDSIDVDDIKDALKNYKSPN
jgi:hypothetical protein